MTTNHTSTPWIATQYEGNTFVGTPDSEKGWIHYLVAEVHPTVQKDENGGFKKHGNAYANADFIVRAVNCHEELLAWVKQVHNHEHQPIQDCPSCALIAKAEARP